MAEPVPASGQRRALPALPLLGVLIALSAIVRSVVAWRHSVPRLFPDEYIYAALGRSLAHGHLSIRGAHVWFPGILEPAVAAPIWRLASPPLAYHLVQVENAVAASLAAIPVYWLARRMRLSQEWAFAAAVFALLLPELVLIAYTSSDALGYTLALTAVAFAVRSLDRPTTPNQLWFLIASTLAALTRVEYVALAPAYIFAAVVIDRRKVLRHWVAALAILPAVGVTLAGALGYYLTDSESGSGLNTAYFSWFFVQPYLSALALGVVIAPGAIAGLLSARGRLETAFATYVGGTAILILIESTKVAAAKGEFKERYLFAVFALMPIAFGLYARRGRPLRLVVVGIAAAIAVTAARLPVSGYTEASFKTDSQSLFAVSAAGGRWGIDNVSLVIALVATAAAILACVLAVRGFVAVGLAVACMVAGAATVVATHHDLSETRAVRAELPRNLRWVDDSARGRVTAVQTAAALPQDLLYQLYFNESIHREVLLGAGIATDAFRAPKVAVGADGTLIGLHGDLLLDEFGTTAWLTHAARVATTAHFTLWRPRSAPRLRLLLEGRFWDGWLSPGGRLRAWPLRPTDGVDVSFRLSLPAGANEPSRVRIGSSSFYVRPGRTVKVVCRTGSGFLNRSMTADRTGVDQSFRSLAVRLTALAVTDHPPTRDKSICA